MKKPIRKVAAPKNVVADKANLGSLECAAFGQLILTFTFGLAVLIMLFGIEEKQVRLLDKAEILEDYSYRSLNNLRESNSKLGYIDWELSYARNQLKKKASKK